jgi:hypothetical protein
MTQVLGTLTFFVFMYFLTAAYSQAQEYDYNSAYPQPQQQGTFPPGTAQGTVNQMQQEFNYQIHQSQQSQARCAAGYGCY